MGKSIGLQIESVTVVVMSSIINNFCCKYR